jgi:tetratricopeptide (TPR) repeat protein
MDDAQRLAEALRALQAGDAVRALALARALQDSRAVGARARMIVGMVHRGEGRLEQALAEFDRAAALAPDDYAVTYERALGLQAAGRFAEARELFARTARLRAGFAPAHRARAQCAIALGDFAGAEQAYADALDASPQDPDLAQLLAQVRLLLGHLESGWEAYARRAQRRHYEAQFAAQGVRYEVPAAARLAGRRVVIVGEQGLGDNLFFLRYAPRLREAGARLDYLGDPRLHPLLARTGLFERLLSDREPLALADAVPVLLGDLPSIDAASRGAHPPSLAIEPHPAAVRRMRERLEAAGPRPWVGVTWRAGVSNEVVTRGLFKQVPLEALFSALRGAGTALALQRGPQPGEIDAASNAFGRTVRDFTNANDDLEDALALTALLDRHVAVSNTNVHLAAAAQRAAEVLVPFPPEWRWGLGEKTPWFPAMRVLRQRADGDWSEALSGL